ncbi:MAG TPA: hypothetical protein VG797_10085 [Phycisphaerales bacterium]|nr:hypothetical protein [Phycisphaerales bacterium]
MHRPAKQLTPIKGLLATAMIATVSALGACGTYPSRRAELEYTPERTAPTTPVIAGATTTLDPREPRANEPPIGLAEVIDATSDRR